MRVIPSSELVINSDGSIFHLHLKPEQLADRIVLVGDPDRVTTVASFFDSKECEVSNREFHSITGTYKGKRISAVSHGIGTDNIDIVVKELDALANIDFNTREVKKEKKSLTILRIGTCGAIQPDIPIHSFIFSHVSVGCDGLLNWYKDRDKVTMVEMEEAFKEFVGWNRHLPDPYFAQASDVLIKLFEDCTVKGVTISAPGFYGPQGRVLRLPLAMPDMVERFEKFRYNGYRITNFEMEGSALAGLSHHFGHRAGTVCCVIANRYVKAADPNYKPAVEKLVKLALEKLSTL